MKEPRSQWPEAFPEIGQAGGAGRTVRQAMVVANPRDDVHALRLAPQSPVETRDLVGGVIGLGAAGREVRDLELARRQLSQLGGELNRGRRAEAAVRRAERQRLH